MYRYVRDLSANVSVVQNIKPRMENYIYFEFLRIMEMGITDIAATIAAAMKRL